MIILPTQCRFSYIFHMLIDWIWISWNAGFGECPSTLFTADKPAISLALFSSEDRDWWPDKIQSCPFQCHQCKLAIFINWLSWEFLVCATFSWEKWYHEEGDREMLMLSSTFCPATLCECGVAVLLNMLHVLLHLFAAYAYTRFYLRTGRKWLFERQQRTANWVKGIRVGFASL